MGIDFPNSPVEGQIITIAGGRRYRYSASVWHNVTGISSSKLNIVDYGAINDGTVDASASITAMGTAVGFVVVPYGNFLVNTHTIDYPLFFEPGGYFNVPSGQTLTITDRIESPRQWIFRGDGAYALGHDSSGEGEDAREVHVSWFGAFPHTLITNPDQGPAINKAFASMGNVRESNISFDIGNYVIRSTVHVTRGGHVQGDGTRRTVFKTDTDGFDMFVTDEEATRFSNIQFEVYVPTLPHRSSGAWIRISHPGARLNDINLGSANQNIVIDGAAENFTLEDIGGVFSVNGAVGSSLIDVKCVGAGDIDTVAIASSSAFGPESVVRIGRTGPLSALKVRNVYSIAPSILVDIDATVGNVSRIDLTDLTYNGFAGTPPANLIRVRTASTFTADYIDVAGLQSSGYEANGILLKQDSSGFLQYVNLSNVILRGTVGYGIRFERSAGSLLNVSVADTVQMHQKAVPFEYSGTIGQNRIDPLALAGAMSIPCFALSIPDDSVQVIDMHKSIFSGKLEVILGTTRWCIMTLRAASTPAGVVIQQNASDFQTVVTALTGTTGADTKFTIGITPGIIYLENRLGSTMTGIATVYAGS